MGDQSLDEKRAHLAELLDLLDSSNLVREQRQLQDMEIVLIQLERLVEILLLHLVSNATLLAIVACIEVGGRSHSGKGLRWQMLTWFWEKKLVDHDVMRIDLVCRELLDEPLRLVQ